MSPVDFETKLAYFTFGFIAGGLLVGFAAWIILGACRLLDQLAADRKNGYKVAQDSAGPCAYVPCSSDQPDSATVTVPTAKGEEGATR